LAVLAMCGLENCNWVCAEWCLVQGTGNGLCYAEFFQVEGVGALSMAAWYGGVDLRRKVRLRDYMLHWFAVNKRKGGNIHLSLESLYRFTLRQSPGVSYTAETVPHSETERTSMAIYEALPIF
jgi:hypothetical protein